MNTPTPTVSTAPTTTRTTDDMPVMTPSQYLKACQKRQPPPVTLPNEAQTEVLCEVTVQQGRSSGAGHTIYVWRGFEARTPTATLEACKRNGWITDTFRDGFALTPLGRFVLDAALAAAHAALRPATS